MRSLSPPPFFSQVETETQRGVVYLKTRSGDSQISRLSINLPFPTYHHPDARGRLYPHLHTLDNWNLKPNSPATSTGPALGASPGVGLSAPVMCQTTLINGLRLSYLPGEQFRSRGNGKQVNTINQTAPESSIGWEWGRSRRLGSPKASVPRGLLHTHLYWLGTQDYVWHFTRAPSSLPIILAAAAPSWRNRIHLAKRVTRNPPVSRSFLPHLQTEFRTWKSSYHRLAFCVTLPNNLRLRGKGLSGGGCSKSLHT